MRVILQILAIALSAQLLSSCSYGTKVDAESPDAIIAGVNVGNEVVVTSKQGKISQFVVTRITNKALYGDGYRAPFAEIGSLEVKGRKNAPFDWLP